jgi:ADP-ribose pyrophosphatase
LKSIKGKGAFQVVSRRTAFRGEKIDVEVLRIRTSSGRCVNRSLVKAQPVVVLIPRKKDGRLILIRQLRVAAGNEILEFPAGTVEKGESIAQCARRELEEETGWRAGRLRRVLGFFPTPGISTEKMHLFIADRLTKVPSPGCDPDEELTVEDYTVAEVEKMIQQGQIIDGKTILGFLFLQRFLPRKNGPK